MSEKVLQATAAGKLGTIDSWFDAEHLTGSNGSDLVSISTRNVSAAGLGGNDEFIVSSGLGGTEINEADNAPAAHNVLLLASDITAGSVHVHGNAQGDIVLDLGNGDTVKLDHMLVAPLSGGQVTEGHNTTWFDANTHWGVQEVRFLDGTVWTAQQVIQMALASTLGADSIYGSQGADTIDGQGGGDFIQGNGGGDTVVFNAGYGALEVKEADTGAVPNNTLQLGSGINPADVTVHGDAQGNLFLVIGNGDVVQLDGMLLSASNGVQQIQFADGTVWTAAQADAKAMTGSVDNTSLFSTLPGSVFDPAGFAHHVTSNGGGSEVLFNQGYGQVEVNIRDNGALPQNVLQFGAGITPGNVVIGADPFGGVLLTVGSNGDQVVLDSMAYGPSNGVQAVRFADGTVWGAQYIISQLPAAGPVPDGYFSVQAFGIGSGHLVVPSQAVSGVQLGAGVTAADVVLQSTPTGDLIVSLRGHGEDSLTLTGDLYQAWGGHVLSRVQTLFGGDGTTVDLTQPLVFTQTGTATNTVLTGSAWGANVFDINPGGDLITVGNGSQGGSHANTFLFGHGDGQAVVDMTGGSGEVHLGPGITAADVALHADNAGNLSVNLLSTGDRLTLLHDLTHTGWGVASATDRLVCADGTIQALGQPYYSQGAPLTFTWIGDGSAPLVGSDYGSNTFIVGPGGTHITAGNNSGGGPGTNTFLFDKGDGHATVDLRGGTGVIHLAADIAPFEVTLQANRAGDLTMSLRGDPDDSITFLGDLVQTGYGAYSAINQIVYADGTSMAVGRQDYGVGAPLTFTWTGGDPAVPMVGSGFGANVFDFGPGGDTAIAAYGDQGGVNSNTFLFGRGDGHVTVDMNGAKGTLQLAANIAQADVLMKADDAGNLTVSVRGDADDRITFNGDLVMTGWGVYSRVEQVVYGAGVTAPLGMSTWGQGQPITFNQVADADHTLLIGSNWGANEFDLAPGGDVVMPGTGTHGGSIYNTYVFNRGDGNVTIDTAGAWGTVKFGAGITASDVLLQAQDSNDPTSSLIIRLRGDDTDSITVSHDLWSAWWGVGSGTSHMVFADGTTVALGTPSAGQGQPLTFTWVADATHTALVGSGFGANVFELAPGGDSVMPGTGTHGGSIENTVVFHRGDGAATVDTAGAWTTIRFGAGISASDVVLQARDTTDPTSSLVIGLRDDPSDSITIAHDLWSAWWGVGSGTKQLVFEDGSTIALGTPSPGQGQPLTFTWLADATHTHLVGSGFGANVFDLAPGGDTVMVGTGTHGGSIENTVIFSRGDGAATVDTAGGWTTISFGAGISASDVVLQAQDSTEATSSLVIGLRGDSTDSLTVAHDLWSAWWGVGSGTKQLVFADGSTMALGTPSPGQGQPITFTWLGDATHTTLVGSGFGANVFELGTGSDTITGGSGNHGGQAQNTYLFGHGDGAALVHTVGFSAVALDADITQADVALTSNVSGGLVVSLVGSSDSITLEGMASNSPLDGVLHFADGSSWSRTQMVASANQGSIAGESISGGSGADWLDGRGGGDTILGGGGEDAYIFRSGYGAMTIDNAAPGATAAHSFLAMGANLTADHIWLQHAGDDLVLTVLGTTDQVTVKNWFTADPSADLASIRAYDGAKLDTGVGQLVSAMESYAASHPGFVPTASPAMPADVDLQAALLVAWHH